MDSLADFTRDTTQLHVMGVEYEERFGETVVHLFCRNRDDEHVWVEVTNHSPSFYIPREAATRKIANHQWVTNIEDGYGSIHQEPLARVETKLPKHINGDKNTKGLREYFDTTYEADVFYDTRFLIDTGIKTHFEYNKADVTHGQHISGDFQLDVSDLSAVDDPTWRATPRVVTIDIEVLSPDGFPEPQEANQPVTAITAYDNYADEYTVWVRRCESWTQTDIEISNMVIEERPADSAINEVRVFDAADEDQMLDSFNQYVKDKRPDLLSGWNSSATDMGGAFDYPYLINRCQSLNVLSFREWSPMGQVWDGSWGPSGKGVEMFDMMKAYKKTQFSKPNGGYGLENIASKELDYGKEDIDDIDETYVNDPRTFLKYNMRDVSAVVGIDESAGVIDLFQNIRALAGVQFENCHNPIDTLDPYIIRFANRNGFALPTNEKPERGWFYGGHVFEPELGRHPNAVYPDVWSEYPNAFRVCNISPETAVGTKEDLEASEYTEDDCRWSYIDTRQDNVKKEDDPDYEKFYYLKPEIKEGFMSQVVDHVMGLKDAYDGTPLYGPAKIIVNATWGVFGDSDSYGKGYRLFDWRLAESITLYGRKTIQYTASKYVDALNELKDEYGYEGHNAYQVGGDSVPADEPTLIRRDGEVRIVSIKDVTTEDEVWTDGGWSGVKNVIKKPNRKQLYTVWTKHGITHVTEDHGLIRDNGEEVTPTEVDEGDPLLHRDITDVNVSGMSMEEERAWLLGLFAAEGSCGIYECESGAKASWAINNQDRELLEHAQEILSETFGVQTKIDDVMESSNTMKLRLDKTGDNASIVLGFREMLYDGTEKRVPKEVLNGSADVQRAFVAGHHAGDGHIAHDHKEFDELWTKHKHLAAGLAFLLRQLGHTVSMHVRTEQSDEYYRIRCVTFTVGNDDEILGIEEYEYGGDYVYDLETENHHFQSGVGSIIVHNTDSVMTSIPFMDADTRVDQERIVDLAIEACDIVNDSYDDFADEMFNSDGEYMELEIESYAPWLFVPKGVTKEKAKKRYAEIIAWDEGDWYDPPEFSVTGIDIVRSDRADVTRSVLEDVITTILREDDKEVARKEVYDTIKSKVDAIENGEIANSAIARPKGMSKDPTEYGSVDDTPMPTYRGAKYANQHFGWENLGEGSKPQLLYIDRVRGEYPSTYTAETKENGRAVDAIACEQPDAVPDAFVVDTSKMIEKVLEDPLTPILEAMGWSFDEALSDSTQVGIGSFM